MEFIEQKYSRATVEFSKLELGIINNALADALKTDDVEGRIGCTRADLQNLLTQFRETYGAVPDP